MNKVILTGRITKDPEMRYTQNNKSNCSFCLAVERQFKDASGNKQADFINCVAWNNQADFLAKYIKKGYMLCVEGRIQVRDYQAQDGTTRYVTEVLVSSVENLQPREQTQQQQNQNQGYQAPNNQYQQQNKGQQNQYQAPPTFSVPDDDPDLPF